MELQKKHSSQWNISKQVDINQIIFGIIFTLLLSRSASEIQDLLSADLSLTLTALRQYPKVYWIWNHRRWCLEHVPDGPGEDRDGWRNANWAKELYFVEKMLDADARNCKSRTCYNQHVTSNRP